jgi:drug/metabolite transporter (DMT)-like permease
VNMKVLACLAFLLNTILFATYYAVAKEALARIDPILFTFFELTTLAPIGLCILAFTRARITPSLLKRGVLLGSSLCLALFTIAIALDRSTATGTAFFPALNGFLAALFARVFLRQSIAKATWCAGLLSIIGSALLLLNSPMGGIRGALTAFLGGLFFTGYVFLSDTVPHDETSHWPLFGIELITMAAWASLVVLLFGNWQIMHPTLPKDALVILYVAGACTFLPTLLTVIMQKYISAVTISFIYILEPVLGAGIATLYLHETLPLVGYIGGGLIVAGAVTHTWFQSPQAGPENTLPVAAPMEQQDTRQTRKGQGSERWGTAGQFAYQQTRKDASTPAYRQPAAFTWSIAAYQLLGIGAVAGILYGVSGFPPSSWQHVYQQAPLLLSLWQQGQSMYVDLMVAQASCWLLAWVLLIGMSCSLAFRMVQMLFRKHDEFSMMDQRSERGIL